YSITPSKSGELRLLASARDARGRTVHVRIYLWVTSDAGEEMETEYANLSLLTDKRRYMPGDTARVLINAKLTGETVLLTVEGAKLYRTFQVQMNKRSSVVRVPVLEEYGPNVSLAACYVRQKKFAQSEVALRVSLPNKKLIVKVTPVSPGSGTSTIT